MHNTITGVAKYSVRSDELNPMRSAKRSEHLSYAEGHGCDCRRVRDRPEGSGGGSADRSKSQLPAEVSARAREAGDLFPFSTSPFETYFRHLPNPRFQHHNSHFALN